MKQYVGGKRKCPRCKKRKNSAKFYPTGGYCKKCAAEYKREWRLKNPQQVEASTMRHWQRKHNITLEHATQLLGERRKGCSICGSTTKVFLDHNHNTGLIRGFLCTTCNTGVGMFKNDVDLLRRAIEYLQEQVP